MACLQALFKYSILLFLITAKFILSSAGQMNNGGNNFISAKPEMEEEKIPLDIGQQSYCGFTVHHLASKSLDLSDNTSRATLAAGKIRGQVYMLGDRTSVPNGSIETHFPEARVEPPRSTVVPAFWNVQDSRKLFSPNKRGPDLKEKQFGFRFDSAEQLSGKFATVSDAERLKIAVLMGSTFNQFLEAGHDQNHIIGLPIDVFESAVRVSPYKLTYTMIPFNGSYDDLLKEVALKNFDAAIGNILIRAEAYQLVEFSQPYVEVGLKMVVTKKTQNLESWLFTRTFTRGMWLIIGVMSVFTGFVVWFIEHQNQSGTDDSSGRVFGTILLFFFATLCNWQRDSTDNSLSLFVRGPWFILVLVVTSTFTANFTSMITNPQFEPSAIDIDALKRTNSAVGCDGSPFTIQYLVKVLGFRPENIRNMFSINDYASALSSGHIKAAFIQMPYAKVLLAKFCGSFTITGPTSNLGSFGFMFSKGSAFSSDMSQAILRLRESGELQLIEEKLLSNFNCSASFANANMTQSLGPGPFIGLFVISGGASVIALLITTIRLLKHQWDKMTGSQAVMDTQLWICVLTLFTQQNQTSELQLARRSSSSRTAV